MMRSVDMDKLLELPLRKQVSESALSGDIDKDEKAFNKALADRIKFIRKGYVIKNQRKKHSKIKRKNWILFSKTKGL